MVPDGCAGSYSGSILFVGGLVQWPKMEVVKKELPAFDNMMFFLNHYLLRMKREVTPGTVAFMRYG